MSAAIWPTSCLSMPETVTTSCLAPPTLTSTPAGNRVHDVVAEADAERQLILALHRRLEADAVDLERVRSSRRSRP